MFDFLVAQAGVILGVVATLGIAALLTARWEAFTLWAQSAWDSLPVIGGIATLARRSTPRQNADKTIDSPSVLALCGNYAKFIRVLDRGDYENYMNYLRKAGDLGRKPFPPSLWFVIFSMIIIEASGLAYVLAGWTMPGASEVIQQVTAAGIGFLIAVILVFFTHWSGVEIYQWNQYRRDKAEWEASGKDGTLFGPDLSLNDPQNVDDDAPAFRQRATRGHGAKSIFLTTVTIMMVIAIGVGAAYVRGQVLEQELHFDQWSQVKATGRFELPSATTDKAAASRTAAERQLAEEEVQIKRRGGWGTLIVLVVIFFFLQLLGMFFGYRYSFNGRLSTDAYRALKADRFSSYSELMQYYDRIADIAQAKVERLQHLIEQRHAGILEPTRGAGQFSFRDFVRNRNWMRREMPLSSFFGEEPPRTITPGPQTVRNPAASQKSGTQGPATRPPATTRNQATTRTPPSTLPLPANRDAAALSAIPDAPATLPPRPVASPPVSQPLPPAAELRKAEAAAEQQAPVPPWIDPLEPEIVRSQPGSGETPTDWSISAFPVADDPAPERETEAFRGSAEPQGEVRREPLGGSLAPPREKNGSRGGKRSPTTRRGKLEAV